MEPATRYFTRSGPGTVARARHEGHVSAGGIEKDVAFADVGGELDDRLDDAYRSKYRRYSENTLRSISSPEARVTTLRLDPLS